MSPPVISNPVAIFILLTATWLLLVFMARIGLITWLDPERGRRMWVALFRWRLPGSATVVFDIGGHGEQQMNRLGNHQLRVWWGALWFLICLLFMACVVLTLLQRWGTSV